MLNNFCFDVFAQKWVFVIMSHVTCRMWHVTCLMSNAYVDPWDMLNNFCFEVYAQKWVLVIMSHVTCHILHVTWYTVFITKKPDWGTQKKDQIRTPYFAKYRLNTDWRKQIKDCHKSWSRRDTEHWPMQMEISSVTIVSICFWSINSTRGISLGIRQTNPSYCLWFTFI